MKDNWPEKGKRYLAPSLAHYYDLEIEKGAGCYLYGRDGKKYLDFTTGIAVALTGHCHPKVVEAAQKQAAKLIHACAGIVYYGPNVELAEKLASIMPWPDTKVFFQQSGSEAIEAALKLARYTTGKPGYIAFKGGFHGRTFGALSVTTSKEKYRKGYEPLLPEVNIFPYPYCYRCPFADGQGQPDCAAAGPQCLPKFREFLNGLDLSRIAALIIEPVLGEGGYVVPPWEFMEGLVEIAKEKNILIIFDEVQTGLGRTGKWLAAENFGIVPDIICLAKGLASGFPIGAVCASASLMDKWLPGAHGSTFTGNPVSCAAGLATLEVIEEEKLLARAERSGKILKQGLEELQKNYPVLGDVRGLGLMVGAELVKISPDQPPPPDGELDLRLRQLCLADGLILISCGQFDQVIRFIPPLIVTEEEINKALEIFGQALARTAGQ